MGKIKRKGAYQYEGLGFHQNQSALVIPMAAEAYMLHGVPLEDFIKNHKNMFDFLLRCKVPRTSKLVLIDSEGNETPQQNICRYYPCKTGGKLVKLMPALETSDNDDDRRIGIDTEWNVKTCNNIDETFKNDVDFFEQVDYDYYIAEARKLIIGENDD